MQRVVCLDAAGLQTRPLFACQILVEKGERGARAVVAECFCAHAPYFFLVSCFSRSRGYVTQYLTPSVFYDPLRNVYGRGQHAADTAGIVWNRAVRKGE